MKKDSGASVDAIRAACRKDFRSGRALLISIIREARQAMKLRSELWGLLDEAKTKDERESLVYAIKRFDNAAPKPSDAIRAVEALYEMSGLKVLQVSETDPNGQPAAKPDLALAKAVAAALVEKELEPATRRN